MFNQPPSAFSSNTESSLSTNSLFSLQSKIQTPLTQSSQRTAAASVDPSADNTLETANDLGALNGKISRVDSVGNSDPVDYFKFSLGAFDGVSVFLNGLSAGHTLELINGTGTVLQSSTNGGTVSDTNSSTTGGSITSLLEAGTYYVKITPAAIVGNPAYLLPGSYTFNVQNHNAPNTVTVAASNSANVGLADYVATGTADQDIIEQAIAQVGLQGGGTVLLLEGTYNISNNIEVTYDNVTLSGVGWKSVLRLADNTLLANAGLLRSALPGTAANIAKPFFSNQHFLHMSLDGNKDGGTNYNNGYANFGTYVDSSFEDIRAHDFPHYGFDPHENADAVQPTIRLTLVGNLADHNGVDGITLDNLLDSTFYDNIVDANGRHGINVVTDSERNLVRNNIVTNNGGSGIVVQPGTETNRSSDSNRLLNNVIRDNKLSGILVQLSNGTEITGNTIAGNGEHGIRLRGASNSSVSNNLIADNALSAINRFHGIYVDDYVGTTPQAPPFVASTNNLVQNNKISSATGSYRNGIIERSAQDDSNTYKDNIITGTTRAPIVVLGPNSKIVTTPVVITPVDVSASPTRTGAVNPLADNTLEAAVDLGALNRRQAVTDFVGTSDPLDYFKFSLEASDAVSVFFNGLSAGYSLDLLGGTGTVLQSSTNSGTISDTNSSTTGGSVTSFLNAGTYYVKITPAAITGNPDYVLPGSYTFNLLRHNAPNTLTIAASNSTDKALADRVASGNADQSVIEQAITELGMSGGGTIVLMEGTYNISDNIEVLYDNVVLTGVGWKSVLRLVDNAQLEDAGLLRSAYHTAAENQVKTFFSNQHFLHMSLDGNKDGNTSYANSYANYGTYSDSSFEDIRAHDFPHYGFDPHENADATVPTVRLTMLNNLADHNGVDGLTTDNVIDSTFANNILDNNGRHGINIVTDSKTSTFENNIVTNNGGNGITVQPGGDTSRGSDSNRLLNNVIRGNKLSGILVQLSDNTEIRGNTITGNSQHGIRLRGASNNTIANNTIADNGIAVPNTYYGIYLDDFAFANPTTGLPTGETKSSTNNLIQNNRISSATNSYRNGIAERNANNDYNTFQNNVISGFTRKPIALLGANSKIINSPSDFNADGKSDILWRNPSTEQAAIWEMDGTTLLPGTALLPPLADANWQIAGTGDFNGDGKSDILWRNPSSGQVVIWEMDGTTLLPGTALLAPLVDASWQIAGTGDFNGDGKSDILWRNPSSGQVAIWEMDGTTLLPGTALLAPLVDASWQIAGTGDFNADGKSDILWRNPSSGQVAIWEMDGTTLLPGTALLAPLVDASWQIAGTGDFNGDGKSDILWRNPSSGQVVIWEMDGTTLLPGTALLAPLVDASWQIAGTGDFNGDGKSDILWRNPSSGQVAIWEMDGTTLLPGTALLAPLVDASWQIAETGA
jgi:parallel beta-helix repeat protein